MNTFLSYQELKNIGLKSFGENVKISRNAILYTPNQIEIGDQVRIDDFCTLSGKITIGSYVHLSQFVSLYGGKAGITFHDFIAVAARTMIYAISDDYINPNLETPMVPMKYKRMIEEEVVIQSHVIFGANTIVLPGVTISEGSTLGAMSLVIKNTEKYSVNLGIPAKKIRERSRGVLDLERSFFENGK